MPPSPPVASTGEATPPTGAAATPPAAGSALEGGAAAESSGEPATRAPDAGLARNAAVVAGATTLSRVLGLVRESAFAAYFGAGPETDAFKIAFRIPNVLRRFLAEALSIAITPVVSETRARASDAEVHALLRATAGVMGVALVLTTLLGMLLAPWVVQLFAPGFSGPQAVLAAEMTRTLFPYLLCVGLTALASGALNAYGHFLMPALAQVVLNVVMIASIVWLRPHFDPPVSALVVGVLVGGVAQLLLQVPALRARGLPLRPSWNPGHPQVRAMLARMGPALFGIAVYNLNVMVSGALASGIGPGAVTLLDYSDRFFELPLGIFAVSVATASLPSLSADAARGDLDAVKRGFTSALALVLCVSIPAAVGLAVLRTPLITLVFERGAFQHADTLALAGIFVAAAPGIAAVGASRTAVQVFYALGQVKTPVRIAAITFAVNAALGFALRGPLGATGLTLANTCSSAVQVVLLVVAMRRALGPLGLRATARRIAAMVAAAACMGGALWFVPTLALWEPGGHFLPRALVLAAAVGGGALLYGGLALVTGVGEVRALAGALRRKLLRRRR